MGDKRKTPAIYCATHWEVRRGTVGLGKLNKRIKKERKKKTYTIGKLLLYIFNEIVALVPLNRNVSFKINWNLNVIFSFPLL